MGIKFWDQITLTPLILAMAAGIRWQYLGSLGRMLVGSDTLEDMLYRYIAFERLFYGRNLASVTRTEDTLEVSWPVPVANPLLLEITLGSFAFLAQRLVPNRDLGISIALPYSDLDSYESRRAVCPFPLELSQSNCRVIFRLDSLHLAIDPEALPTSLDLELLRGLPEHTVNQDLLLRVVREIARLLPERRAGIPAVAESMGVSTRTLQRQLSGYPDGLRGLTNSVREGLACNYLLDATLSLSDIALLLGYSEQSAFNLAFRRWKSTSPGAWRRQASVFQGGGLATSWPHQ